MNANTTTPALRQALTIAHAAPQHTLQRCRGGFHDAAAHSACKVTRRTANTLHNAMLADFDERDYPSTMTLTTDGVRLAQDLCADARDKAASA